MAKQKGIIKLNGTIGDITFYKTKDGYIAREKGALMPIELLTILHFKEHVRMDLNLEERVKPVKRCDWRYVLYC